MSRIGVLKLSLIILAIVATFILMPAADALAVRTGNFTGKWSAQGEWELLDSSEGREIYTYKLEGPVNLTGKKGRTSTFWSECVGLWDAAAGGSARCVWRESQSQDEVFIDLYGQMVKDDAKVTGEFVGGTGQFEELVGTLSFTWSSVFDDSSKGILTGYAKDLSGSYLVATLFEGETRLAIKPKINPWERFSLELGGGLIATDSSVRLGTPGIGLDLDIEELLGTDAETGVFFFQTFWRFTRSRRHRIDFSYFRFRRSGEKTLGKTIEIGGIEIPADTTIKTTLDYDIFRGSYSWSFFQDDRIDLAISAGLFVMPIRFKFEASGLVEESVSESITAPLPVIGFRTDYAITYRVFLKTRVDFFWLEIDNFTGTLIDLQTLAEYRAFKHFAFGGGLNVTRLNVDSKKEGSWPGVDFVGNFRIDGAGVLLYLKYYF